MELIEFTREITWLNGIDHGWGNGYVAVPKYHLLYGVDYSELHCIDIHGGLTYSGIVTSPYGVPEEVIEKEMWVFGFDCAHYGDTQENCPKEFVIAETKSLKEQLSKVRKETKTIEIEEITYVID